MREEVGSEGVCLGKIRRRIRRGQLREKKMRRGAKERYELVDEVERDDFKVEGVEVAVELDEEAGVVFERNFLFTLTAVNFLMGWVK